ncbi:MAG: family 10 glycosylhydrolase [Spirochaetales bacterium]|nr:family 10 glycosylhydrolase [Spirochaetales bacterium]
MFGNALKFVYPLLFVFLVTTPSCRQFGTRPVPRDKMAVENCSYTDDNAARNAWKSGGKSGKVSLKKQKGIKAVRFPCLFSSLPPERSFWDKAVALQDASDMTMYPGIRIRFYCADLSSISHFYLYLKSGTGWYYASFYPRRKDCWDTITIPKSSMQITGSPEGYNRIEMIRLAAYPCSGRDTWFAVSEIAMMKDEFPVAVIRNESVYKKDPAKGPSVIEYTNNVSRTLSALGMTCNILSDTKLSLQQIRSKKVLILPYNPAMSDSSLDVLKDYLLLGGHLISFYILPPSLRGDCGFGAGSFIAEEYPGYFYTMRFEDETVRGIPPSVVQASWNIIEPAPIPGKSKTLGSWYTVNGENTGLSAAVISDNCVHFSHVLLQDDPVGKRLMLAAILEHFFPGLKERTGYIPPEKGGIGKLEFEKFFESGGGNEFRGVWCANAAGIPGLSWDEAVGRLKESRFTDLFPNMGTSGIAYYKSSLIPNHAAVKTGGDRLDECLTACNKNGIRCHVWKICFKLGQEVPASFLSLLKKEKRLQVSSSGTPSEAWLCPSHPKNRELETAAAVEIVRRYRVHGIHLDYIRYPSAGYCFCDECRKRFEEKIGRNLYKWPEEIFSDPVLTDSWENFRRETITGLVERISEEVKKVRPGIGVSAAVFPNPFLDREEVAQEWGRWCERRYVDFVCPMTYTDNALRFGVLTSAQLGHAYGVPCYPGIGISVWDTPYDMTMLFEQIRTTRELKTGGFMLFAYDRELSETIFGRRPD